MSSFADNHKSYAVKGQRAAVTSPNRQEKPPSSTGDGEEIAFARIERKLKPGKGICEA